MRGLGLGAHGVRWPLLFRFTECGAACTHATAQLYEVRIVWAYGETDADGRKPPGGKPGLALLRQPGRRGYALWTRGGLGDPSGGWAPERDRCVRASALQAPAV
eukprot:7390938-Prymnesium_polylepis.1